MARKAKDKSAAQKAFDAAKEKREKAREANEKNDNPATQAALTAAETAFETAKANAARDRFVRIGNIRVGNVLKHLTGVGEMNKSGSYQYTADDVSKIETLVSEKLKNTVAALRAGLEKAPAKEKTATKAAIFS